MREIEVKAKVESLDSIIDALKAQGADVTNPVTQHDVVYGPKGVDGGSENTAPWLRIRTETKADETVVYFTMKKSVTNQLDSIEHETAVGDADELQHIISHLDFELYSDLTKTRQKAHVGDIEICLDYVDELGYFVEAEKLTSDEVDYDVVVNELWTILEGIGASRSKEITDGYDVLMVKHLESLKS